MQQTQCVLLAWRNRLRNISRVELDTRGLYILLELKLFFNTFLLNCFNKLNLYKSYVKINNDRFLIRVMEQKFHSVKDEMFHSGRLRLVKYNDSSFTS